MNILIDDATRFLKALDPDATRWTFQTFDDNRDRRDKGLARILHGTLEEHAAELERLNALGAGIFVCINRTNFQGRSEEHIIDTRARFADLDGAPLEPVLEGTPLPHIVVESSPGKWQVYWRVHGLKLDQFYAAQKGVAARYNSDPAVCDLPRVMRVPGFFHCKGEPFRTRIVSIADFPAYSAEESLRLIPPSTEEEKPYRASFFDTEAGQLNEQALANLSAWVPKLFPTAHRTKKGWYRVKSADLGRGFEEDLSLTSKGIKYFGVHDMGDPRGGRRSPIDTVMEWNHMDFKAAMVWLREALGQETVQLEGVPVIKIVAGELPRAVNDTQDAIVKAMKMGLPVSVLRRADFLVQPLYSFKPSSHGRKTQVTILKRISVSNLRYMVDKWVAIYNKWNQTAKKDVVIDAPTDVLQTLLDLGHWPFSYVSGVINAPTMRPDGTVLVEAGYDEATGLWHYIDPNLKVPEIEARPDKAKAVAALKLFEDLLDEFPFVADVDLSVTLAAILTSTLRGAFVVAPMFLFTAHTQGTGKSYLVDLIASIVQGRWCPVIGWHASEEEIEKRIGALLLEGVPIISIDNCSSNLEGDSLARMAERPIVKVRILGKSEMPECEWRGTLLATGNNIGFAGDMIRRGLPCNLDAQMERPETRSFAGDPIAAVMADRGKYIAAALTIARAYAVSGERIECDHPIASYGEWSRFVREPLIWLGKEDPVKSQEQSREDDPDRNAALQLIDQWRIHLGTEKSYKTAEIIAKASAYAPGGSGRVLPHFFAVLLERAGNSRSNDIDARKFGNWLKVLRGRVYDQYRIVAKSDPSHGNSWRLDCLDGGQGVKEGRILSRDASNDDASGSSDDEPL